MSQYSIDPSSITIEQFREILGNKRLLPGRIVLQEKMEERFSLLKANGLVTLADLLLRLRDRNKQRNFAELSGLESNYLTILYREANSYLSKPVRRDSIP